MRKIVFLILFLTLTTGCTPLSTELPVTKSPILTEEVSGTEVLLVGTLTPTLTRHKPTSTPSYLSEFNSATVTPQTTPNLANIPYKNSNAKEFLSKYGWTVIGLLGHHEVILPATFLHEPGDFPISIYWAYNNELSKAIGLDLTPYLGTQVHAIIYELEELPFERSDTHARGIVILSGGEIIGAWIDASRHLDISFSLDNRTFQELVGLSWGKWLVESSIVDKENDLDKKLAEMTQTQIIQGYYDAINDHNYNLAYAYLSRKNIVDYLFLNMLCCTPRAKGNLFQSSYESGSTLFGIENIKHIHINEVKEHLVFGTVQYYIAIPPLSNDPEPYFRIISLEQEVDDLGYRIASIDTGP